MLDRNFFVPMCVAYQNRLPEDQAVEILGYVQMQYNKNKNQKVGLIYSANHGQTVAIRNTYAANQWYTGTSGGGQALVINKIEELLKTPPYQHLQSIFRILPITTCAQSGGLGNVLDKWLQEDLDYIAAFMQGNNTVLGWQNPATKKNPAAPYAIGGGISKALTPAQNTFIQNSLIGFQTGKVANDLQRKHLIMEQLQHYVARVESHKNAVGQTDYSHGFWVLATSRAANRKANCETAKKLIHILKVQPERSIQDIFSEHHIDKIRAAFKPTRSIHSSDLNHILEAARNNTPLPSIRNR